MAMFSQMKSKPRIRILAIAALALLCSCSTKYAQRGGWPDVYGYSDEPIDATTYQVTFAGNTATSPVVVNRYALFRAAEVTVSKGFDYFVVMNTEDDVSKHTVGMISETQLSSTTYKEHTSTKTIRMFKGTPPADNPQAYDAKSMLNVMGPTIERDTK